MIWKYYWSLMGHTYGGHSLPFHAETLKQIRKDGIGKGMLTSMEILEQEPLSKISIIGPGVVYLLKINALPSMTLI